MPWTLLLGIHWKLDEAEPVADDRPSLGGEVAAQDVVPTAPLLLVTGAAKSIVKPDVKAHRSRSMIKH